MEQLNATSNNDYLAARRAQSRLTSLWHVHSPYVIYTSLSSELSLLEVSKSLHQSIGCATQLACYGQNT